MQLQRSASQIDIKPARDTSHEKAHSFLFIHNQSNTGGELDPITKIPLGQAGDANAILLGNKHDVLVTSMPIDPAYLAYWKTTLSLTVPQIFTPKTFRTDLLHSILDCKEELVKFIREKQKEGVVKKKLILSIFEADEEDVALLKALQAAGLGDDLDSECNYDLLPLGNKDGFREFCHKNQIVQLPGGTFKTVEEVEKFLTEHHKQGHTVVIKSPRGIGGGGQLRMRPPAKGEQLAADWKETVTQWIKKEKAVEAEQFADSAESEHVVDIYIDPMGKHHTAVMFDQLVRNDNASAGMAYFGAKYPSASKVAAETIMEHVEASVAPALEQAGYRGPAGVDVLWNPLHFMELNMRTDAITYVKHLTDRLGKNLYQAKPGSIAFMSLVNLPLSLSLPDLLSKHGEALQKQPDGIFALSNPNRQKWGFFDVVAVSPSGIKDAEKVMARGLEGIWGKEKAEEFMRAIYHPHPQLVPAE